MHCKQARRSSNKDWTGPSIVTELNLGGKQERYRFRRTAPTPIEERELIPVGRSHTPDQRPFPHAISVPTQPMMQEA
jgi:hypothetical protein